MVYISLYFFDTQVDAFSDSCDALTSVQHYKGCGSCCEWKDIPPYRTAVSIATSPSGIVLLPTMTESLSTLSSLQDIPQVSTYHLTLLTHPPAKLASTTFTRQLTSPCGRTSTTQMQPEGLLPTASAPMSFPLSSKSLLLTLLTLKAYLYAFYHIQAVWKFNFWWGKGQVLRWLGNDVSWFHKVYI